MTSTNNFSHRGWTFSSVHKPISDARDIDNDLAWLQAHAGGANGTTAGSPASDSDAAAPAPGLHALPEMYFGNNSLDIRHPQSGFSLQFDPREALAGVEVGASGKRWQKIKVKAAETWQRRMEAQRAQRTTSRTGSADANATTKPAGTADSAATGANDVNPFDIRPEDIQVTPKPYDWTFSTDYVGAVSGATPEPTDEELPLHKLRVQEPILFYDENILYEDELGDNGVSKYSIKIRVMPSCFFILARLFLRVDNVMFALHDTRIYHAFGSDHLLREYSTRNVDYMSVKDRALRESGTSGAPGFGSPGMTRAPALGARPPAGLRGVGGLVGGGGGMQGGSATNLTDPDHPMVPTLMTNEGWVGQVVAELSEPNEVKKEKVVLGAFGSSVAAEVIPH